MFVSNLLRNWGVIMNRKKVVKIATASVILGSAITGSQQWESLNLSMYSKDNSRTSKINNANSEKNNASVFYTVSANVQDSQKFVYLSDIPYMKSMSSTAYKSIMMDKTTDNTSIKLKINGNPFVFEKGVFAHAKSTIVYDLTNYQNYTYFTTWYGVSNHMGGGGSVKFYIYTSVDGVNWDLETSENPDVMNGNSNAQFVKINIRGKKYLKLYADPNGENGQDHSLYADAKFTTEDYSENATKTVEEYDELLKTFEGMPIEGEYLNLLLQRELVDKTGQFILNNYVKESEEQKETLDWLMNTPDILNMYIMGGTPDGGYYNSLKQLSRLYHAYKDDFAITEKTRTGQITYGELYKKLAISLSLSHSTNVYLWMQPSKSENISDPVERYRLYKYMHKNDMFVVARNKDGSPRLNANGKPVLDNTPVFENLEIEEMRYVVNNIIDDESIIWLNEYTQQYIDANPGKENTYLQPHYYMNYIWPNYAREEFHNEANKDYYNIKYGVYKNWDDKAVLKGDRAQWHASKGLNDTLPDASKINGIFDHYGVTFKNGLYKLWMNIENGAVCGGISKIGSNIRGVHGLPSSVISQPGHAALIYYVDDGNGNGYWNMDNGITGWQQSGKTERMNIRMPLGFGSASYVSGWGASYIPLSQDVINRFDNFTESKKFVLLADTYKEVDAKYESYLREALRIEPRNLEAWEKIVTLYLDDSTKTESDYYDLANEIAESLKYYPLPMYNLINLIKPKLTSQEYTFKFTLLQTRILKEGSVANENNIPEGVNVIQPAVTRQVASYLLGQFDTSLASFSFNGEDGGKLVLSNRFDGAGIRFDYSLDGGKTWTEKSFDADEPHKLDISSRIGEITAENDIKVHLVGVDYSSENIYTIDITKSTLPNNLYRNDLENRLINATNNMEWRIKGSDEWTLVGDNTTRFNDYIAHEDGNYLEVEFRVYANGTCLASDPVTYKFFKDDQPRSRTYIPIKHLKVAEVSSEATANNGHAIHAIDGDINSIWHSNYSGGDTNKFITIELDEAKYISGLDYVPRQTGSNGRINHGKMFVSMDGKEWTLVSDFNWGNSAETKTITLDESVQAKYVKLQAITNYGDGRNFITAMMINLYEDLDGARPRAEVAYSTKSTTTESVIVTVKPSRKVTITDAQGNDYRVNEEGNFEFVINTNKEFTVTMVDDAGRVGSANINVDWIVDYDFSFSGDNAGVIKVGEKYLTDAGEIEWKYSIDGGNTWKTIENKLTAILSDEEIEQMTETNGLQLGIHFTKFNPDAADNVNEDGTISVNIPVVAGRNIPYQTLYANDLENKIIGATNEMEWRYVEFDDDGLNILDDNSYENLDGVDIKASSQWARFNDNTPKFTGEKKVQVRYAPHDATLPGEVKTFKFTTIEQDEKHTYIPLDKYKVSDYSSETNRPGNYEVVTNAIDGNKYTMWHTSRTESVNGVEKYITIELDKPRHITKLEAIGKDNYEHGNIKDGSVWVSMDGTNWTKVAECHDGRFANASELFSANAKDKLDVNTVDSANPLVNVKVFEFEPVYAKYIKLQCDKSHDYVHNDRWGLVNGQDRDYFLNLTMVNLYEDTKQVEEDPIVLIDYNIMGITNQDVIATIYSPNSKINVTSYGGATHKFSENGKWLFEYQILDENDQVIKTETMEAEVSKIDKKAPTAQVVFNEINPSLGEKTKNNVNVTVIFDEEVNIITPGLKIINESAMEPGVDSNTSKTNYKIIVFENNTNINLEFVDLAGNKGSVPIVVDCIDRETPTASVEYSTTEPTTEPVTVTLNFDEPVTLDCKDFEIIKNNDKSYSLIVTKNTRHKVIFYDAAGNYGEKEIVVDCIENSSLHVEIEYSTKKPTTGPVIATLKANKNVVILTNGGEDTYTFTKNGEFEFKYVDEDGNQGSIKAVVDWIDSEELNVNVTYDISTPTNGVVVATIHANKPITISNNGASYSRKFTENGTFTFEYCDAYGNTGKITASVNWIDKILPTADVKYSTKNFTNKDVTVTLLPSEKVTIINNDGKDTYTFTENGSFIFKFVDAAGNYGSYKVEVDWIYKKIPLMAVDYTTNYTNNTAIATLELRDGIRVINNGGKNTYEFTENGEFIFDYVDKYGNVGHTTAVVDWLQEDDLKVIVQYNITEPTTNNVIATVIANKSITIVNNGGKNTYVFTENGEFTFGYVDENGNAGTIKATVSWIKKIVNIENKPQNSGNTTITNKPTITTSKPSTTNSTTTEIADRDDSTTTTSKVVGINDKQDDESIFIKIISGIVIILVSIISFFIVKKRKNKENQ